MKCSLFLTFAIPFVVIAQDLATDNFDSYALGNISTDIMGSTPGPSGYLVYSTNSSSTSTNMDASAAQFTNYNGSKAIQLTGPNGDGGACYVWKDGLSSLWDARTAGNDIVVASVDFTIPADNPSSYNSFFMALYDYDATTTKVLCGFYVTTNQAPNSTNPTWTVRPYLYFDGTSGGGVVANYLISLNPEVACSFGSTHNFTISYNKTDGMTRYQFDGGVIEEIQGAAMGSDVKELDFVSSSIAESSGAITAYFDNVYCVATNNLLLVEDLDLAESISKLYPNPTQNTLKIQLATPFNPTHTNIKIVDKKGSLVHTTPYSHEIDISKLPKGVYFINISDGLHSEDQKFIKE